MKTKYDNTFPTKIPTGISRNRLRILLVSLPLEKLITKVNDMGRISSVPHSTFILIRFTYSQLSFLIGLLNINTIHISVINDILLFMRFHYDENKFCNIQLWEVLLYASLLRKFKISNKLKAFKVEFWNSARLVGGIMNDIIKFVWLFFYHSFLVWSREETNKQAN